MTYDVFVSYSSKDKAIADGIVSAIEQNSIRCWYAPRDIKPSEDWGKAIANAIQGSRVFLMVFSGNANQSQHVLDELLFAINMQAVILPFRIENLEPEGAMQLHLSSRHWLDAYHPSWESHLKTLIKNISIILETALDEQQIVLPAKIARKVKEPQRKLTRIMAGIAVGGLLLTAGWFGLTSLIKEQDVPAVDPVIPAAEGEISLFEEDVISPSKEVEASTLIDRNGILDLTHEWELDLDPQNRYQASALDDNLFLTLTNFNFEKSEVIPEAAESWGISMDAKLYTFKIRQDIPWVTHPLGGETIQELDENGNKRFVSAHDFVYAIRRICDPQFIGGMEDIVPLIKGCQDVYNYQDPNNIPEELFSAIGVQAVSDSELLIELTEPSAYFLSITTDAGISALPQWAIEKYGDAWKSPGTITTNGYYVIDDIILGESIHLVSNRLLPEDMAGAGNIGTINILIGPSIEESYQLWTENKIDFSEIPDELVSDHLTMYPDEYQTENNINLYFFALNYQKAPFNNVHVRRAFASSIDKTSLVDKIMGGNGLPMIHLGPPGFVGALPFDEVGLEFNVDFARDELALGGYPNCQGLPQIRFLGFLNTPQSTQEEIIQGWEEALGCKPGTITIYNPPNDLENENIDIALTGTNVSIPDVQGVMTLIHCEFDFIPIMRKNCNQIDAMIEEAKQEINSNKRSSLYAQIEEACFGPEGVFPIIPAMMRTRYVAVHKWLEPQINSSYQMPFYNWTIDTVMKQSALLVETGE